MYLHGDDGVGTPTALSDCVRREATLARSEAEKRPESPFWYLSLMIDFIFARLFDILNVFENFQAK